MFTKEQRNEALKKLPEEAKDFILSSETEEIIEETLGKVDLNEEEKNAADSEILYAMYGLQTLDEAVKNIPKSNDVLKSELQKNVFNRLAEIIKNAPQTPEIVEIPKDEKLLEAPKEIVAEPLEPVVELKIPEVPTPTPPERMELPKARAMPEVTPAEPPESVTNRPKIADYPGGIDPYREPTT